jgi:putative membrane protein
MKEKEAARCLRSPGKCIVLWGWGYPWMGTMRLWMGILSLTWLLVLGVVSWALVRWVSGRSSVSGPAAGPSAIEILGQRYARREIDPATVEEKRARLGGSRGTQAPMRYRCVAAQRPAFPPVDLVNADWRTMLMGGKAREKAEGGRNVIGQSSSEFTHRHNDPTDHSRGNWESEHPPSMKAGAFTLSSGPYLRSSDLYFQGIPT